MSISAIPNSSIYEAPETRKAQSAPAASPAEETPSGGDRAFRVSGAS